MMQMQKRISILISSDNLGARLPLLLQSIADQTNHDWQVIVVDNSGERSTVLQPPVYVLRNPRPQTLARSMTQALELVHGSEFVMCCRDDLVLAPNALEACLEAFEQDQELGFVWPSFARARYNTESTEQELIYDTERVLPRYPDDEQTSCVCIRMHDLGLLRPSLKQADDLVMRDVLWRLTQLGSKGRQADKAVAWLQPGAALVSPGIFRYWTWVWTRRMPRS